jgi:hypothetical protein
VFSTSRVEFLREVGFYGRLERIAQQVDRVVLVDLSNFLVFEIKMSLRSEISKVVGELSCCE